MAEYPLTKDILKVNETPVRRSYTTDQYHKGAFLSMKAASEVQPVDAERYDTITYSILKAQTLVFASALYWTRLLEVGNFSSPKKSRLWFYMTFSGLPSIVHAVYASYSVNSFLHRMDEKYSEAYFQKFLKK